MRVAIVCLVVGWLAAGCGATSEHPLSDESDSIVDEHLIGVWDAEPKDDDDYDGKGRFLFGRLKGSERSMEAVWTEIDNKDHIKVVRAPLHAVALNQWHYLSVCPAKATANGKTAAEAGEEVMPGFFIWRYEIKGEFLTLFKMDSNAVGAAIDAKQITGTFRKRVEHKDGKQVASYSKVHLTATQAALRTWIVKAADTIWERWDSRLRRVDIKKKR